MKKNKKILLVEDNESLGYLLSEYLQMKDFDVLWKKNGNSALAILDQEYFDLIILDVMLPDIDGFTLAKKIKQDFTETPFIFLTARSLKIDVLKGFALGAVDYLKKPIDEEELVVRLNTLLNSLSDIVFMFSIPSVTIFTKRSISSFLPIFSKLTFKASSFNNDLYRIYSGNLTLIVIPFSDL